MKTIFSRWYANEVKAGLDRGMEIDDLKVDLRASVVKPLHANWLMIAISTLKNKTDSILNGFVQSGMIELDL